MGMRKPLVSLRGDKRVSAFVKTLQEVNNAPAALLIPNRVPTKGLDRAGIRSVRYNEYADRRAALAHLAVTWRWRQRDTTNAVLHALQRTLRVVIRISYDSDRANDDRLACRTQNSAKLLPKLALSNLHDLQINIVQSVNFNAVHEP